MVIKGDTYITGVIKINLKMLLEHYIVQTIRFHYMPQNRFSVYLISSPSIPHSHSRLNTKEGLSSEKSCRPRCILRFSVISA